MPRSTSASGLADLVTIFGRKGSFGDLSGTVATVAVPGWSFLPGQAAYFTAVDARGRVAIANEPQTDNQTRPTADTMSITTFDPSTLRFTNGVISTSSGASSAVAGDGSLVGGADIADLELIAGPDGQQRLAITSSAPYNGWDPIAQGVYPAFAILNAADGAWRSTPNSSYSASHLHDSSATGASICDRRLPTSNGDVLDCGGLAEIAALPHSERVVATRYFGHPETGPGSGGLAVLDPDGSIVAGLDFPQVTWDGQRLSIHPREVDVDPTGDVGDERFLVIFDVFGSPGTKPPFVAQEFSFDASTATIAAITSPFVSGDIVNGQTAGTETAVYDHDGNLWIAEAASGTLTGGPLVRYGPHSLDSCDATLGSLTAGWGRVCRADYVSDVIAQHSLVRSLIEDQPRHRVVAVTIDGTVAVASTDSAKVVLQLPLDELVDRSVVPIGPRKGSVDIERSVLWIPVQQLRPDASCRSTCPPAVLDQWLARIDLARL